MKVLLSMPLGALATLPAFLGGAVWGVAMTKQHGRSDWLAIPLLIFLLGALAMVLLAMGEYR